MIVKRREFWYNILLNYYNIEKSDNNLTLEGVYA